eukprot:scaffold24278_cov150-Skeletonema_marinoi.AAC.1
MQGAAKRQPPPPPPPRFYNVNTGTHHLNNYNHSTDDNNNNNDGSNHSDMSQNSSMNDLSVLSPNLKSYLDKNGSHRNNENVVAHHGNATAAALMGSNDQVGVTSPLLHHHRTNCSHSYNNSNEYRRGNEKEEKVYSPHLAALSSPPLTYTTHTYEDDGLLHSIFSAKKHKKKRTRRRGKNVNNKGNQDKSENDVLGLFSPGVQEFDLEEALADDDNYDESEPIHTHNREEQGRDNNEDEVTLDSVDRIVRGDYLKCNNQGGDKVASASKATAVSFTSPPATATGSTPPAAAGTTTAATTPVIDNTVKTPNYSTPYSNNNEEEDNEYFYTPVQHKSDNNDWTIMSTASRGGGSLSSSLAPVWEAEEEFNNEDDNEGEVTLPFQTPLEYHHGYSVERKRSGSGGVGRVRWNMVEQRQDNDYDGGEGEEEFFSPLAVQHRVSEMTTPKHQHQQQRNVTSPPLASPKYSEMREELQQMLMEAKRLTPRKEEEVVVPTTTSSPVNGLVSDESNHEKENVQPTSMTTGETTRTNVNHTTNVLFSPSPPPGTATENSFGYSPPPSHTPNSHHHHYHYQLHSSSISNLPPEQLTLDFVKQCDCLNTLKGILSRLSSEEDHDVMSNSGSGKDYRGKKQLKYPSMVRYVEKRIKIVADASSLDAIEDEDELLVEEQHQVVDHSHGSSSGVGNDRGDDKEDGMSEEHHELLHANQGNDDGTRDTFIQEGRSSVPPPLETLSLSQSPREERNEVVEGNEWSLHYRHRQITPENQSIEERSESMMTHETSLDMNLSVSLDDESYFWRQDGGGQQDQGNQEKMTSQQVVENNYEGVPFDSSKEESVFNDVANTSTAPQGDDFTPTHQHESYTELQEKLASSLAAHAQLTERVESLVKEHASIKDELTSRLDQAREQLSQRQIHASVEKKEYTKQVSQLIQVNQMLEREMSALKGRIEVVDQKAVDAACQADLQLDQTRLIQAQLSKENERLGRELDEAHQARDRGAAEVLRLKQLLDEQIAGADASNNTATKRIKKGLEAAKFANHALANALAISERDLSEALHQKEKSLRECNSLRERIVELEDKSSWLSSKVNEMTKELQSSQKYIDTLYADLQSNRSPSKEMKAELERRELQWLELEHQYTRRIQELERQNASQSGGSKVSMADYVAAVRECRSHQSEAVQKQQVVEELESTISSLKHQIEAMRRRLSPRNGVSTSTTSRGKSIATIRNYGKKVHNQSSVGKENDENKAPASSLEQREGAVSGEMGGKTIRRISALKAVGGRKGLSEQLRRARRVGGEE